MPDNSGRPDLRQIAEANAQRRQPSIVIGTGTPTEIAPGDTFIPTFRQPTQPEADPPYLWIRTDPETGEAVDVLDQGVIGG